MSTYSGLETSVHGGRPAELFRFVHGTQVWAYSSGPEVEYNGETYVSLPVGRAEIEQTSEVFRAGLDITVPRPCEVSRLFSLGNPSAVVTVTVFRQHIGGTGVIVYWKGRIVSVSWPDSIVATLSCESVFTSLRRPGLRARYQRMCRHALYEPSCGVDRTAFAVVGVITAADASGRNMTVLEAAAFAAGYFTGGYIHLPDGAMQFIEGHSGSSIALGAPTKQITALAALSGYGKGYGEVYGGAKVTLYPGCARTRDVCKNKFSNILNFGGWPWIPSRNPFDGRSIL
ncbi:MAG: hypothetical protein GXY42_11650 [Desulfovibrionales bacterium]|nr:hypothetical protein [Desulfovibrionales bacterium]